MEDWESLGYGRANRPFSLRYLDAALWQRLFPWEPPTIDLYSPLKPEEMLVRGNLLPDWWQRLPFGERLARFGREKQILLRPSWWQNIFLWMSAPKPAKTREEVVSGLRKMKNSYLRPAWWQKPFQRMPKLPN